MSTLILRLTDTRNAVNTVTEIDVKNRITFEVYAAENLKILFSQFEWMRAIKRWIFRESVAYGFCFTRRKNVWLKNRFEYSFD